MIRFYIKNLAKNRYYDGQFPWDIYNLRGKRWCGLEKFLFECAM